MNPLRQQTTLHPQKLGCPANEVGATDITSSSSMASGSSTAEAILAHMPGMVYRAVINPDRSMRLSYVSEGIQSLTGLSPDEAIAHSQRFYTMMHPEDRAAFGYALDRSLKSLHSFQHEYRLITPDGSVKWIMDRARLICSPDGTIILDGVCVEVSDYLTKSTTSHHPWSKRYKQSHLAEQRRREWIEFLGGLSQSLYPALPVTELLALIAHDVRTFLQVDRIVVTQITPSGSLITPAESVAPGWPSLMNGELDADWFQDDLAAFCQGHTLVIEDVEQLSGCPALIQLLRQHHVKAGLFLPILTPQGLWGLLSIHQCLNVHRWSLTDIDFLKQLAVQISVAIQHSEAYHQLQRLNSELERKFQARTAQLELAFEFEATLKRITDKVRDSLDEDQILQTAVQELAIAIGVSGCNAALYDLEQGTSTICYEYTTTVSPSQGRVAHMRAFPEIYAQLFNGISFQFCSVMPNPVRGHVAMLTCPILDDQGVLGDLWLINHKFYAFSEQDIRLVEQVANQCAIALRQARLYKAAQVQVAELERLNHLKDDFLSRVSHELRTPIASIKMASQMLEISLNKAGLLTPEANPFSRYLNILQGECQREMSLVNDLLDLSRLEAEADPLQFTSMPLQDWISGVVEPFVEKFEKQSQQLRIDMPAGLIAVVSDFPKLSRILTELLQNACKYTPSGKIIRISAQVMEETQRRQDNPSKPSSLPQRPRFQPGSDRKNSPTLPPSTCLEAHARRLSSPQPEPFLLLQVSNSGAEIPIQERSRIFEKFYRIPNAQDPWRHGGTGLGLALVKKLVDQLQGHIEVLSEQEVTTFTVKIPLPVL